MAILQPAASALLARRAGISRGDGDCGVSHCFSETVEEMGGGEKEEVLAFIRISLLGR